MTALRYRLAWASCIAVWAFGLGRCVWFVHARQINFVLLAVIAALLLRGAGCR